MIESGVASAALAVVRAGGRVDATTADDGTGRTNSRFAGREASSTRPALVGEQTRQVGDLPYVEALCSDEEGFQR